MAYCIVEVRHREFPDASAVGTALAPLGLTLEEVVAAFRGYICPLSPTPDGYGAGLVEDIKAYLEKTLPREGLRAVRSHQSLAYSRSLHEHADFGLIHDRSNRIVFFEIAFRHNYERDLLKFQIGASEGTLAAAVMVLSIEPRTIDAALATLPSYDSVIRVLEALKPSYPLVAVGLRGSHAA